MTITCRRAGPADAAAIAALQTAAAADLTARFGRGHWSARVSEARTMNALRQPLILLAESPAGLAGLLRLATKKPWAIDPAYFTPVKTALYLTDMAVAPEQQRRGVGRGLLAAAVAAAREWPAGAIRLDAYDAQAGAGGFYAKCGFREVGRVVYRNAPLIYFELLL